MKSHKLVNSRKKKAIISLDVVKEMTIEGKKISENEKWFMYLQMVIYENNENGVVLPCLEMIHNYFSRIGRSFLP